MTYVIAEPCVDVKNQSCVDVCPVSCIYIGDEAADRILRSTSGSRCISLKLTKRGDTAW